MNGAKVYYDLRVKTADVVKVLVARRDQVASIADLADALVSSEGEVRKALDRLAKVGRVDEIFPNLWHLE